ncbi:60S ribosomal L14 [Chlorella sorokiniana]|jgi:large subunit ribosomal protein L14e|uniref:60S ribosomal L14 n=1 Tax=Chlorella sorokiniana TaxID=3076 RepID=A0A2P6U2G0_CHLSO|nr:60S ribosomal L14 [Chlorella sorokiniana]|eukprot:PRW60503.1 60S ribosomal L14 [Chlorella sorokiniana]
MPFARQVSIGRVALVQYPEAEAGKLVVISDVVSPNAALVDFPGQTRRVISFKRLAITDYTVDIPRLAKKAVLKKALEEADVEAKFAKSAWGQKLAKRAAKAATTDFDRYKAAVQKMKRSAQVRRAFNSLKKAAK